MNSQSWIRVHPNPTQLKIFRPNPTSMEIITWPNPTQSNLWMDSTHVQLCESLIWIRVFARWIVVTACRSAAPKPAEIQANHPRATRTNRRWTTAPVAAREYSTKTTSLHPQRCLLKPTTTPSAPSRVKWVSATCCFVYRSINFSSVLLKAKRPKTIKYTWRRIEIHSTKSCTVEGVWKSKAQDHTELWWW